MEEFKNQNEPTRSKKRKFSVKILIFYNLKDCLKNSNLKETNLLNPF
jgi:hypothetical protein